MVKPYSCVVCGWRFHLLHNMQRHLATHKTKDKVPVCKTNHFQPEFSLTPHQNWVLNGMLTYILTQGKSKGSEEEKGSKKEKSEEAKE